MRRRIAKVLAVALLHGHHTLVLGAWGCGAFGNDSEEVAELFHEALTGSYSGAFARVVFAITDWSEDGRFIRPFRRALGLANNEEMIAAQVAAPDPGGITALRRSTPHRPPRQVS
jgi:hypothetical protein